MIKLSEKSYKAMHYPDGWVTNDQILLFRALCSTLKLVRKSNIRSGQGKENQLVKFLNRKLHDTVEFYVMQSISTSDLNFAAAFGFGHHDHELTETTRYLVSPDNAFMRGKCNPSMARKLLCSEHYMQLQDSKHLVQYHVLTAYVPLHFTTYWDLYAKRGKRCPVLGGVISREW